MTNLNKEQIKNLLPHREPMLLIDELRDIKKLFSATAIVNVKKDSFFVNGHFPGEPVMPGVLIVEAMAQTAAVLVAKTLGLLDHKFLVYFLSIEKAKFRKPVEPGDMLNLIVNVTRNRGKTWKFNGHAIANEVLVAESDFTAMMVEQ